MSDPMTSRSRAWEMFSQPDLSLDTLEQRALQGTLCDQGLRSVFWRIFLDYLPSLDQSTWSSRLTAQRKRYDDLRNRFIIEPLDKMKQVGNDQDLSQNNPLALNDSNPWQQYYADMEIRKVIRQDVDRTFPSERLFRQVAVQEQMTDILFVYCQSQVGISYRQGMHELLAPMYAAVSNDMISTDIFQDSSANQLMLKVLDARYVEHDAYILFEKLMAYAKRWYEVTDEPPNNSRLGQHGPYSRHIPRPQETSGVNPVVATCHRIHNQYLSVVDPYLYKHLENVGVEPQLYGIRWLRLLFGREFDLPDLMKLWDAIFAVSKRDQCIDMVEYVYLAFLLRLRDELMQRDDTDCLPLLMRTPKTSHAYSLVSQAEYLRMQLSKDSTLRILRENDVQAGKEPRTSLTDGIPPQYYTPGSQEDMSNKHRPSSHLQRNSMSSSRDSLASMTREVFKKPQVREFNKVLTDAFVSVQKNVHLLGENVRVAASDPGPRPLSQGSRRSGSSSEFPPGIDRILDPTGGYPGQARATNSQAHHMMGDLMTRCIRILEREIFQRGKENAPADKAVTDEGAVVMALAGIKHVRDVLVGKQPHFDPAFMPADLIPDGLEQSLARPPGKADLPIVTASARPSDQLQSSYTSPAQVSNGSSKLATSLANNHKTSYAPTPAPSQLQSTSMKPSAGTTTPLPSLPQVKADDSLADPLDAKNVDKRRHYEFNEYIF